MQRFLIAAVLAVTTITGLTTSTIVHADVSASMGQPGFFGQLNIDGYPPPQVRYRQPIAIGRVAINRQPIYLHVPTSHSKQWKKYCRNYNACDERVLFVRSNWYNREYVTRYQGNQRGNQRQNKQARGVVKMGLLLHLKTAV